jgi:hypothetical protein
MPKNITSKLTRYFIVITFSVLVIGCGSSTSEGEGDNSDDGNDDGGGNFENDNRVTLTQVANYELPYHYWYYNTLLDQDHIILTGGMQKSVNYIQYHFPRIRNPAVFLSFL